MSEIATRVSAAQIGARSAQPTAGRPHINFQFPARPSWASKRPVRAPSSAAAAAAKDYGARKPQKYRHSTANRLAVCLSRPPISVGHVKFELAVRAPRL